MKTDRVLSFESSSSKPEFNVSDWGIEAATGCSNTPTISHQSFFTALGAPLIGRNGKAYYTESDGYSSSLQSPRNYRISPTLATTKLYLRFVNRFLSYLQLKSNFWEDLKYNIVTSGLLDDTMILSKNDQAILGINAQLNTLQQSKSSFRSAQYPDGVAIDVLETRYKLCGHFRMLNKKVALSLIRFIIFLLKQDSLTLNHTSKLCAQSRWSIFALMIIFCTKYFHYRTFDVRTYSRCTLSILIQFLFHNYQFNRRLILGVILLKELHLFNFFPQKPVNIESSIQDIKPDLATLLNATVYLAIQLLTGATTHLLEFVNGDLLEQYCNINNVSLDSLVSSTLFESPLEKSKALLQLFNKRRKLLLCVLLAFCDSKPPKKTFFVMLAILAVRLRPPSSVSHGFVSKMEKRIILRRVFTILNRTLNECTLQLAEYTRLENLEQSHDKDQDVLEHPDPKKDSSEKILLLIAKVESLAASLKLFKNVYPANFTLALSLVPDMQIQAMERLEEQLCVINEMHKIFLREISNPYQGTHIEPFIKLGLKSFRNFSIQSLQSPNHVDLLNDLDIVVCDDKQTDTRTCVKGKSGLQIDVMNTPQESYNEHDDPAMATLHTPLTAAESEVDGLGNGLLCRADLSMQLERSLNRIYVLESENQCLRAVSCINAIDKEPNRLRYLWREAAQDDPHASGNIGVNLDVPRINKGSALESDSRSGLSLPANFLLELENKLLM